MGEQLTLNIQKIEVGTIVWNRLATKHNPFRFFIYQDEADGVVQGLGLYDNELINMRCFAKDEDGLDLLEVVGHSKYEEDYKRNLRELGM